MAGRRKKKTPSSSRRHGKNRGKHGVQPAAIIEEALQQSSLPENIKSIYRQALTVVFRPMSPIALARFCANVKECRFYETHSELTAAIQEKFPKLKSRGVVKGGFDREGTLHLDGGGVLFGRAAMLSEFYAHEIAHAIDGTNHEISNLEEWRTAWESEKVFLSVNGKKSPSEGFAEFGEMLLGAGVTTDQMKEVMPNCLEVWQRKGL